MRFKIKLLVSFSERIRGVIMMRRLFNCCVVVATFRLQYKKEYTIVVKKMRIVIRNNR